MSLTDQQKANLLSPAALRIMALCRQAGGEARLVGGAVRDALLARPIGDFDFAVTLPPKEVASACEAVGLKVVPTGIDHGTLTIVIDGKGYEITTLRRDLETDGRHAKVGFDADWGEDAARRDFTINALYVDRIGTLYDFCDGFVDLQAGLLRFIGDPEARLREDALRLLRLFRFYAQLSKDDAPFKIDSGSLEAATSLAPLLRTLSAERIGHEMRRLLSACHTLDAWKLLSEKGVHQFLMPEAVLTNQLAAVIASERKAGLPASWERAIAALVGPENLQVIIASERLALSRREQSRFKSLKKCFQEDALLPMDRAYLYGKQTAIDYLLLKGDFTAAEALDKSMIPIFPLTGKDIIALGIGEGPEVGELLCRAETEWRTRQFIDDRDACLAVVKKLVDARR